MEKFAVFARSMTRSITSVIEPNQILDIVNAESEREAIQMVEKVTGYPQEYLHAESRIVPLIIANLEQGNFSIEPRSFENGLIKSVYIDLHIGCAMHIAFPEPMSEEEIIIQIRNGAKNLGGQPIV